MTTCLQCGFDNPAQMRFCVDCGHRLTLECTQCGAEMLEGYKFCGACGLRLEAQPDGGAAEPAGSRHSPLKPAAPRKTATPAALGESEGERKQATVLFCELIVPGSGGEALDPDGLHSLLNRFLELAQAEVERYEGTISRFLEQGFMALFGAPIAHEDHALRAVLAAIGLSRESPEAPDLEGSGARWRCRMGIDTGSVVVGAIGTSPGTTALGETTSRAARLLHHARPGQVLISGGTAAQVQAHIELEAQDALAATGGDDELEVFRVLGGGSGAAPARFASQGPFIGRRREMAALDELRQQADEGRGQVVGIVGEAGAGKSRLADEFQRRARTASRLSYLRGSCASYGAAVPYRCLIDMIRKASGIAESDAPQTIAAKLAASLERVGSDASTTLPYLLHLLGVEAGAEELAELEPQALQHRTFAAMRRMLLDASRRSLVIMELEDIHWIDPTSEEFLASLVEAMGAARLFLLLTHRPGFQPPWLDKSYVTQIALHRLSGEESREWIRAAGIEDDLGEQIIEKAEGNPLFLEELARSLAEDGTAAIPNTVQDILMTRIDRLPEAQKQLLRVASVLGREFTLELLEAIWVRQEPLAPLLEELRRAEFLYKAPAEDQTVHFFKHALTQEVAYESLLSRRREELHRQAAAALEELYGDHLEDAYDRLVYHLPRAGEPEKTVHYLTLFARRAARDYAHAEAAEALREALQQAASLEGEEGERRRIEVLLQLAESLLPLAGFPETLELCERHQEIVERIGDASLSARFEFWLAHTHTYLGHQEATRQHARRSIEAARECGDETTEGKACYVLGRDGFWSGQFAAGIENSLRAVVLLERSGEPWWQGQAYWVAGFNHYVLGEFGHGIEALERAFQIGEALDDYRLDTSWSLGYFHASLGDGETGIELCRRGLERSRDPLNTAVATGFLGHALLRTARLDEATVALGESVERLEATGMRQILGWFTAFLAEAREAAGELDRARETARVALQVNRESEFWYGLGLAQTILGRIESSAGRHAEAREALRESLMTFERLGVPFEIARVRLELARLERTRGEIEKAAQELELARRSFEDLGAERYVELARELAGDFGRENLSR